MKFFWRATEKKLKIEAEVHPYILSDTKQKTSMASKCPKCEKTVYFGKFIELNFFSKLNYILSLRHVYLDIGQSPNVRWFNLCASLCAALIH